MSLPPLRWLKKTVTDYATVKPLGRYPLMRLCAAELNDDC
jgi:hypothetical protein